MNWNARSIKNKTHELEEELKTNNIDIVAITETHLDKKHKLKIKGYDIYRKDRNSDGGGSAVLIKKNIKHEEFILTGVRTEINAMCVKVYTDTTPLYFVSVYIPPDVSLTNSDILNILAIDNNTFIVGDLNCRHPAWNCNKSNKNGRLLNHIQLQNPNIKIYAPDEPTYYPTNNRGQPSVLDLTVTNSKKNMTHPQTKTILSSDHNPVYSKIIHIPTQNPKKIVYNYKNANWEGFKKDIECDIPYDPTISSPEQIDALLSTLTTSIMTAAANNIPKQEIPTYHVDLPNNTKALIKIKNIFRKKSQKTGNKHYRQLYNRLNNLVKTEVTKTRNNIWNDFLKSIDPQNGNLWRVTKTFMKKTEKIPPLITNSTYSYSSKEKANTLADYFEKVHKQNVDLGTIHNTKMTCDEVKKYLKTHPVVPDQVDIATPYEVKLIIKKLKNKKSPGPDGISPRILKQLPRKAIILLTKIINHTMLLSYFPTMWKLANLVPIKKPGKPSDITTSYRPISLLNTLSKVAEKIYLRRINDHLNSNNLLINEQFGFRAGHSTATQLARLADTITKGFNLNKHTGMVLLDIEKAFDTVWHKGLILKLIKMNFPPYLIHLINSYIQDRSFQVIINNIKSTKRKIEAGVPQGSILGPTLFCIFINDFPRVNNVLYSLYADDTAITTQSWRTDTIIKRLKNAAQKIIKYMERWKIKINESKSEAILFTKRRPLLTKNVNIHGTDISWAQKVKYLGLHMDKRLNFTEHCKQVSQKATASMTTLFPLLNRRSSLSVTNKILLYKSIIRPTLLYASPVWSSTSNANYQKMQVIQNKCLRIAGNYPRCTKISQLHNEMNTELIKVIVHRLTETFFSKCDISENPLISAIGQYELQNLPFKRYKHKLTKHILLK